MTTQLSRPVSAGAVGVGIPEFCFLLASLTVVIGMGLGIFMGIMNDHQLAPVHAHLNVIGWLSMFMLGLYYKAHADVRGPLVSLQVGGLALGYILMTGSLAIYLIAQNPLAFVGTVVGALLLFTSMIVFVVLVVRRVISG